MAKEIKNKSNRMLTLPGVNNYDKLKNTKTFNKFNPFLETSYSNKAKQNAEASSLDDRFIDDEIYQQLLLQSGFGNNPRTGKRNSYYGLDAKMRRQQLLRMSVYDIIDEVLTKITDETIVNAENNSAIKLQIDDAILDKAKIKENFRKELVDYAKETFKTIKKLYGLDQHGTETSLWYKGYLFLTEGTQAYEIVWDDINNPKKIIAIHEIDALDLEYFYYDGIKYWKHHKILSRKAESIIMYDTQIVKIDYSISSPNNRMSYLEHLIKTFNDLRIIDETTIIWSVTNAAFRTVMKVPTNGLSRTAAMAAVNREQTRWEDEIVYDNITGEITVNNRPRLQMMKNYYMGNGNSGSPDITTIGGEGPDMSDTSRNEFFEKRFYKAAKIPYSRIDSNSSSTWNIDTRSQLREEIYFSRFIQRIQSVLKMLVLKPLKLQLVARFPELRDDDILDAFNIKFNSYNIFEELMELDILQEKVDAITKLNDAFVMTTPDGTEMKKFALQFLLEKFLPELTQEDYSRNNELLEKEHEELFKFQIKSYKLKAKYDPEMNLSPMGIPNTEEIISSPEDEIEDIINFDYEFDNNKQGDDENTETKNKNSEETKENDEKSKTEDLKDKIKSSDDKHKEVEKQKEKKDKEE